MTMWMVLSTDGKCVAAHKQEANNGNHCCLKPLDRIDQDYSKLVKT